MSRVHAVHSPLSPYLQFALGVIYPESVAAGEEVRILEYDRPDRLGPDFWLLDDTVCLLRYDDRGKWLGVDLLDEADTVARYAAHRDALLRDSVPLAEFDLGRE